MRSTPFELVFGSLADERFPKIRAALAAAASDPSDRDAFLMLPDVLSLLREIRPDEGVGEGIDQLVALVHHAYLAWDSGLVTLAISDEQLEELLRIARRWWHLVGNDLIGLLRRIISWDGVRFPRRACRGRFAGD